jgi:hypothetical protein
MIDAAPNERSDDRNDDRSIDARIAELEQELPHLRARHPDMFGLACVWAERHDALLADTPAELRTDVQARLRRIGIRWGLVPGARLTRQFPALPAA